MNLEYINKFRDYEDNYLKINNIKIERFSHSLSVSTLEGYKCSKLSIDFKLKEITDRQKKIISIYLKWSFGFIEIDEISILVKLIISNNFDKLKCIVVSCIHEHFNNKLYQDIILNNLLEVEPPKNIKLTMKMLSEQRIYLYNNIDYFDFNSVIIMEELSLEILNKKINEINLITNTLINIQKKMGFQFVLQNINKYNLSNIEYLYQINRLSYHKCKTLLLTKEII